VPPLGIPLGILLGAWLGIADLDGILLGDKLGALEVDGAKDGTWLGTRLGMLDGCGDFDGILLGLELGELEVDGAKDGTWLGTRLGIVDGWTVGSSGEGCEDKEGSSEGTWEGIELGCDDLDGSLLGAALGDADFVGSEEGTWLGTWLGIFEGNWDGLLVEGSAEGTWEGIELGWADLDGSLLGTALGETEIVGSKEGNWLGAELGLLDGLVVGSSGEGFEDREGSSDGTSDGTELGSDDFDGLLEGPALGAEEREGISEGFLLGAPEGVVLGWDDSEGEVDGTTDGTLEGAAEGQSGPTHCPSLGIADWLGCELQEGAWLVDGAVELVGDDVRCPPFPILFFEVDPPLPLPFPLSAQPTSSLLLVLLLVGFSLFEPLDLTLFLLLLLLIKDFFDPPLLVWIVARVIPANDCGSSPMNCCSSIITSAVWRTEVESMISSPSSALLELDSVDKGFAGTPLRRLALPPMIRLERLVLVWPRRLFDSVSVISPCSVLLEYSSKPSRLRW
jgi:hypothetical protein